MNIYSAPLLALSLSLGPAVANAQTPEASALQKVLGAKLADDDTNDPLWRVSLATAFYRYCESIVAQVPRNTPQEDRWLNDEFRDLKDLASRPFDPIDDPDSPLSWERRMNRVLNSVENARQSMRRILSECSSIAKKLFEGTQAARAAEALLWVQLSRLFSNEEVAWQMAETVGLVSLNVCRMRQVATLADILKGRGLGNDKNDICSWNYFNNVIMDHAVIPLLKVP